MIIPIDDLTDSRLAPYVGLTDLQLRNRLEPSLGIFIAEGDKVIGEALHRGCEPLSFLVERRWISSLTHWFEQYSLDESLPIYEAPVELIAQIAGYKVTRGALGAFRRPPLPTVKDVLEQSQTIFVLSGVTNAMNVGAIFRNGAALGVDGALVESTSVDPLYRRALRSSMGTALALPFARYAVNGKKSEENIDLITLLREHGFTTLAFSLDPEAISLDELRLPTHASVALVFGSEGEGLSEKIVKSCDQAVRIPMRRSVDSLNVASASAIAFWELSRQLKTNIA